MTTTDENTQRRKTAARILANVDGTLLADIRSMRHWATTAETPKNMGRLNFALMAISLIGCERLGLLTSEETRPGKRGCGSQVDPGQYIIEFIGHYFPRKHPFKRIAKILADGVRHELVHGFGGRQSSAPFVIGLYVSADTARFYEVRERPHRRPTLAINAVTFADAVLAGAANISRRLDREPALVDCVLAGAGAKFTTPKGVIAEWNHGVRGGRQ